MVEKKFKVADMHCSACAMRLEGLEDDLPGVQEVKASYQKGVMVIKYDETLLDVEKIIAAVGKLGYTAQASS